MTNHGTNGRPPVLPGCSVLPPMEPSRPRQGSTSKGTEKPKRTAATSNRFGELNAFVDVWSRHLTTNSQAVWFDLFRETKPSGLASMSVGQLAIRRGISPRTAERALKELRDRGHLTVVKHGNSFQHVSNLYRVHSEPVKPKGKK